MAEGLTADLAEGLQAPAEVPPGRRLQRARRARLPTAL